MSDIIKAIKEVKEVYVDFPMNSRAMWLKVSKKELLERFAIENLDVENELEIVTRYGKSNLYLGRKVG